MDAPVTPRAVVDALGGRKFVAKQLDVGTSAISNWIKDGFPKSRMPDLLRIAGGRPDSGVTLDVLMGMEANYPERAEKAA
jgi:hypothetical protein